MRQGNDSATESSTSVAGARPRRWCRRIATTPGYGQDLESNNKSESYSNHVDSGMNSPNIEASLDLSIPVRKSNDTTMDDAFVFEQFFVSPDGVDLTDYQLPTTTAPNGDQSSHPEKNGISEEHLAFPHMDFDMPLYPHEDEIGPTTRLGGAAQLETQAEPISLLHQLCELHIRLLSLQKMQQDTKPFQDTGTQSGTSPDSRNRDASLSDHIVDLYAATEDLISLVTSVSSLARPPQEDDACPSPGDGFSSRRFSPREGSHISTALMISNCYVCLLHTYELLVENIWRSNGNKFSSRARSDRNADFATNPSDTISAHHTELASSAGTNNSLPRFRIGLSQFTMPVTINQDMHMYFIAQMMERLRAAIWTCIPSSRVEEQTSVPTEYVGKTQNHSDLDSDTVQSRRRPSTALLHIVSSELEVSEQSLMALLHQSGRGSG
ncbi:hypothetical protein PFICI_00293 [Pestalotiopsis fici W106-1]|uniref:Aflatoxin regulatory protein domain-containing protein n=1 Tax=Pestalotiopsis fici (strain W106-1 / CGMCC3.15140) TaxID=1229662 RepID=W3XKD8_PESFW|nr:uncharacterized protein PFICI_00293 [Pestalotiopsis fici W106-1]ETS86465.1 hypothetical protein PFICI_00293 [Pestalotiopsis fici W106-1]